MNLAQATWAPGTQFSRYEILGRLARGGMAEVWRAAVAGVQGFRRQVVIKTMRPELAVSPDLVRMFINEATIAARLNHPGIMHVFDFGQLDERYFIAMEYVPGLSLRQLGRALRARRQRLPYTLVLRVAAAVARTLSYAHTLSEDGAPLGFVHRDISPENIMVSSSGATKLIDFGAAMTRACPPPGKTLVGKFRYLSPERLRGHDGDARADIYALGIVLYECLTGRRPYDGTHVQEMIAAGGAPDPCRLVPGLPARLGAVVLRAMAVDPDQRYGHAADLADDLIEALGMTYGRDPLGATEDQANAILREQERESADLTVDLRGDSTPLQVPARATTVAALDDAQGPAAPASRMSHARGTSVAVVVSDPIEAEEEGPSGGDLGPGIDADIDAAIDAQLLDPPGDDDDDDDDAVETHLFVRRGGRDGGVSDTAAAAIAAAPKAASNAGGRPTSAQELLAACADRLRTPDRREPPPKDPLAVVRRSLPELHGAPAWFGASPADPLTQPTPPPTSPLIPGAAPAGIRTVSAAACFERGLRLIAARDLPAALVQWRRASALDPERSWYRSNLERLVRRIESERAR